MVIKNIDYMLTSVKITRNCNFESLYITFKYYQYILSVYIKVTSTYKLMRVYVQVLTVIPVHSLL